MRHVRFIAVLISLTLFLATACSTPATVETPPADPVTVFEGARLIVGDGSGPIEDAAFVVQNGQFTGVGASGQLNVPAGAQRWT